MMDKLLVVDKNSLTDNYSLMDKLALAGNYALVANFSLVANYPRIDRYSLADIGEHLLAGGQVLVGERVQRLISTRKAEMYSSVNKGHEDGNFNYAEASFADVFVQASLWKSI
ncbi:hypothetical protein PR003_g27726, partial [Phytophthora rubi]